MSHEYDNYAAITVGLLMSDAEVAREVLHTLDAALHPWSEPGEIPREQGDYWACEDGHVFPMTVVGPRVSSGYVSDTARYRKRWKPEPALAAKPDTICQFIPDDPCMDDQEWLDPASITDEMRRSWPVWEFEPWHHTQRGRNICTYAEIADVIGHPECGAARPLRLPGMSRRGEVAASQMTAQHFARVAEWQWRAPCTDEDGKHSWCSWSGGAGNYGMQHVGQYKGEMWRPAVFAKLDPQEPRK